jgi:hypothetical protein
VEGGGGELKLGGDCDAEFGEIEEAESAGGVEIGDDFEGRQRLGRLCCD